MNMLKRPKILVVGSLNMDVTASTKRLPKAGETVIGEKFRTAPGGKGLNQAVQCARLGACVTMVGKIGNDEFGMRLLNVAKEAGVDISHISTDEKEATGTAVIMLEEKKNGTQNRITVCPGANYTICAEELLWLKKEIKNYDMVILQFEIPMSVVETVAEWAHEKGVAVMVNPAPAAEISDRLLSCATYLSPNEHEAASLAGHTIRVEDGVNYEDVKMVADYFLKRGVENLIITMGENGAVSAGREELYHAPCVKMPEAVDPTAAGDSFVAAFCTGLTAGMPQEQALAFAGHTAAITVSRRGAINSLPDLSEVQDLLRKRGFKGISPDSLDGLKL